jgi:hypothetical protein
MPGINSSPSYDDLAEILSNIDVTEINHVEVVQQTVDLIKNRRLYYHDIFLPLLFNLRNKPITLKNHFQMRSLFAQVLPEELTYKTARQVSKSVSNGLQSIFIASTTPYYNILHITPLFEMIRKFSTNYVKAFIEESPLKGLFINKNCSRSVLQQSLRNGSNLIFTFAFNDCTRIRGNTANAIKYDEYQSLDPSFEPIINQTISAVNAGVDLLDADAVAQMNRPCVMRFGTPLTMENGLEQMWEVSSQAEWAIPCRNCRHPNIPSLRQDLEKMLGPRERKTKVTPDTPGLVCAKCGHYLYTREGRWMHDFPERREIHSGYHIPQCIMPFHCENEENWQVIQRCRFNRNKMSQAEFYNEVCGESYDHGQKLISVTDLRAASVLPARNRRSDHLREIQTGKYLDWGMGVDWGGGGASGISRTAFAFAGLRSDGVVEVFSGYRSDTPNDFNLEGSRARDMMQYYGCEFMAIDFHGSGNRLRYDKVLEFGIPRNRVIPISYVRVGNGAVAKEKPADYKERIPEHIQMNKARSFIILSHLIRAGRILFFQYDYLNKEHPGLLRDFTALTEDRVKLKQKGEIYTVIHDPKVGPDDFADAVNYVVGGLFIRNGGWPDTGFITSIADLTEEQQRAIDPMYRDTDFDWFDMED